MRLTGTWTVPGREVATAQVSAPQWTLSFMKVSCAPVDTVLREGLPLGPLTLSAASLRASLGTDEANHQT